MKIKSISLVLLILSVLLISFQNCDSNFHSHKNTLSSESTSEGDNVSDQLETIDAELPDDEVVSNNIFNEQSPTFYPKTDR